MHVDGAEAESGRDAGAPPSEQVPVRVRVRLLGPVQVVDVAGAVVDLPSRSQRRLLALLALHVDRTLRGELLCEWLDVGPGALRTTVSRLRRRLGDDVLCTDPLGYRLVAGVDAVDFARQLAECAAGGASGGRDRVGRIDRALDLWRGSPLDEFHDEPWARGDVSRLEELRADAVERRASELIELGRLAEAIAALEAHVAEHPLRDRPRGLLMTALAADGRQAEALRAYQRYRSWLASEVGTEPSAEVRRIEERIAQAGGTSRRLGTVAPRPGSSRAPSGRMPTYRSSFVGRRAELAALVEMVGARRTVTLVGEGGVGKTRLAVQTATTSSAPWDAVWFVDLAPFGPAEVRDAVALAVGAPVVDDAASLAAAIGHRRVLLVLDNCEHVLDAAADVVDDLTCTCPNLVVVATSREPLSLEGEQVVAVAPLAASDDAPELFSRRAAEAGCVPSPHDAEVVAAICRRLDGNALAIELAAARAATIGLQGVRDGLDDRFALLSAGRRHAPERHRSLHAVVDWSYRLLSDDEQHLFRHLGIFSSGFELDAATELMAAVGAPSTGWTAMIGALVGRNLLVRESRGDVSRFRLLETLRDFARAELAQRGELASAARGRAEWIAALTDVPTVEWMTADAHRRALRLEREVENWRDACALACDTGDVDLGRRLCGPPSVHLVWGRPDLGDVMVAVDRLLPQDDPRRACTALAAWGPAWAGFDVAAMRGVEERLATVDADDRTGARAVIAAACDVVTGHAASAIARRTRSMADARTPDDVRDYHLVLSLYLACSSGASDLQDPGWRERVEVLAERSPVATNRQLARIALAWSYAHDERAASLAWTRAALVSRDLLPAFMHNLAETFLSRFLCRISPGLAAAHLRELFELHDVDGTEPDTVSLVVGAALMSEANHPCADDAVTTLAHSPAVAYLATLVADAAERRARGSILGHVELVECIRAAVTSLAEIDPAADVRTR